MAVNASVPNSGTISVDVVRHDADAISSVAGQTQQWLYRDGGTCSRTGGTCTTNASCGAQRVCSVNTGFDCSVNRLRRQGVQEQSERHLYE